MNISLNGLTQRYIAELKTVKGFSKYATYVNLFTDFMKEFPASKDYILTQYDLLGDSVFSEETDGITLVVDANTTLTDLVLAQMGFFEHDEFLNIAKRAVKMNELPDDLSPEQKAAEIAKLTEEYPYRKEFEYEDIIGKEFIYFPQDQLYTKGKVADDKTTVTFMALAMPHIYSFTYDEENDALTGTVLTLGSPMTYDSYTLLRTSEKPESVEKLSDYVCGTWEAKDEDDNHLYGLDFTGYDPANMMSKIVATDEDGNTINISAMMASIQENTTQISGYHYQAELNEDMKAHPENYGGMKMKISGVLRLKSSKTFGCLSRGVYYSHAFGEKYINDSNTEDSALTKEFKEYFGSEAQESSQYNAYVNFDYWDYTDDQNPVKREGYASSLNGDLTSSFSDLFSSFTGVNYVESDKVHLRSVCGFKAVDITNDMGEVIDYEFEKLPREIDIYPKSFEEKDIVTDHLSKWNSDEDIRVFVGTDHEKVLKAEDRSELTYTDTIKLIISIINTLITTVTIALVSFTSLALVVSCFMIAVITYISVVERTKEIGIIRSVGGRKKDVSRLFITETFMTGLFSGLFGIIITYIFEIIFNIAMYANFKIMGLANLTVVTALIMLGISILLSVLSGLIPSMKASHQDPVIALRSNE